ncbi:patatin-like phospholipase family protein [Algimonas porphyrae]|uniref:PNPLA domain-containing protein n=1 Tax=Algimonas porphyrae TaxID=1128113 RepID=A0ABQ5V2G2_9PROT|nr:patatin-like phospholipase family protein [Algimonas porphyrae]GLQ21038.1 hypothetical protein GCM10007854_19930 [Algimonas porphyrae]
MNEGPLTQDQIRYLAFEGGGAMGTAYLGALVALEEKGLLPPDCDQIEGVSGSSIGAIVGMCVGMGYGPAAINARLVRDRPYRLLHAEPFRKGLARRVDYDGRKDKTAEPDVGTTTPKILSDFPLLIADYANRKAIAAFLKDQMMSFLGDWLTETATAIVTDEKLVEDYVYRGALGALKKNRLFLQSTLLVLDLFRKIDQGANPNAFLMPQFIAWLDGEPFEEGWFENEEDRLNYIYYILGTGAVIVLLNYVIRIAFGGPSQDGLRNKALLLKVISDNIRYNMPQPWLYKGLVDIGAKIAALFVKQVQKSMDTIDLPEPDEAQKAIEKAVTQYLRALLTSEHVKSLIKQIFGDSGLFAGLTVRVILAELIYGRVEVLADGQFVKRDPPIDWSSQDDRDDSPDALPGRREDAIRRRYMQAQAILRSSPGLSDEKRDALKQASEVLETELDALEAERTRQMTAIIETFTMEDYYQLFDIELCVTGSNVSTKRTVFFNRYLTPKMPVVDAVGISSSFPFLFKPTRLTYTGGKMSHDAYDTDAVALNLGGDPRALYPPATLEDWYRENYHGWFIDGGLLNNIPINAFNGHASGNPKKRALSPIDMLYEPLNRHVLGFVLDTLDVVPKDSKTGRPAYRRHGWIKNAEGFETEKVPPGLISMFLSSVYETPMAHSTRHALPAKAFRRHQVVMLDTPGVTLFDLIPVERALRDADWGSYKTTWKHLTGAEPQKTKAEFESVFDRDNADGRKWRRNRAQRLQRRMSRKTARRATRVRGATKKNA